MAGEKVMTGYRASTRRVPVIRQKKRLAVVRVGRPLGRPGPARVTGRLCRPTRCRVKI